MAQKVWILDKWFGGLSTGTKLGVAGSYAAGTNLDIRTDPDLLSSNFAAQLNSGATVSGLVKWGQEFNGSTYFYADNGALYQRTAAGVWSLARNIGAGSTGQGLELFNDRLYYAASTQLGQLTTAGVFDDAIAALNADTLWHPLREFLSFLCVGNGRALSTLDTGNTLTQRFLLPVGLRIKSLEVVGDYLAIGAWRGTAITDFEEGYLFFWDGIATTWNSYVPLKESGVNALLYDNNQLMVWAGTEGNFYVASGSSLVKLKRIPNVGVSFADVWPGAVTRWNGITHFGVAGETGTANVVQGVYSWGATEKNYPEVLNHEHAISTGTTTGTTLQIGCVYAASPTELYIGWRDGASFGVDLVSTTTPYTTATYESIVFDGGTPSQEKVFMTQKLSFAPLPANTSIALAFRADRATAYTTIGTVTGDGSLTEWLFSEHIIANAVQFRLTLTTTAGTTPPRVQSLAIGYQETSEV